MYHTQGLVANRESWGLRESLRFSCFLRVLLGPKRLKRLPICLVGGQKNSFLQVQIDNCIILINAPPFCQAGVISVRSDRCCSRPVLPHSCNRNPVTKHGPRNQVAQQLYSLSTDSV